MGSRIPRKRLTAVALLPRTNEMLYYPVFLYLKDKPCLMVGGGKVAERKTLGLLKAGAKVTLVGTRVTEALERLSRNGSIKVQKRPYRQGDVKGHLLVIAATGSKKVNEQVYREAQGEGVFVNVVDDPERCSFIVPSVVDRGALLIAISTSGKSPYLARVLREEIEACIGMEFAAFADILGAARKKLLKSGLSHDKKERIIKDLVNSPLPGLIKDGRLREINSVLKSLLGDGYSLSKLGVDIRGKGREERPSNKGRFRAK